MSNPTCEDKKGPLTEAVRVTASEVSELDDECQGLRRRLMPILCEEEPKADCPADDSKEDACCDLTNELRKIRRVATSARHVIHDISDRLEV